MKKNKNIYYYLIFIFIIILIFLVRFKTIENYKDIKCIQRTPKSANNLLKPIITRLIKYAEFENKCTAPFLIINSFDEQPTKDIPFVYYDGESSFINIRGYNDAVNNPNCIGCFVTNLVNKNDKTYYLPLFLELPDKDMSLNTPPIVRKYTNVNRKKVAVYIAHHSPPHREKMFNLLRSHDNTVESLGQANNTHKVKLPQSYSDLPEVYKDYKFVFAMENKDDYGYITEKIANAYMAGSIPIYWGTEYVKEIFNIDSFIYVNGYSSFEECAKDIIAISNDPMRYEKMKSAPIFNPNSKYEFWRYYDSNPTNYIINIVNQLKQRLKELKKI